MAIVFVQRFSHLTILNFRLLPVVEYRKAEYRDHRAFRDITFLCNLLVSICPDKNLHQDI
jgi:hypothetical protein